MLIVQFGRHFVTAGLKNQTDPVQYPTMKTVLNRLFKLAAFICVLGSLSGSALAQGKKVFVGTGSGIINYPTAQATLNLKDDDTVVINPGKYKLMNFQNITASPGHKIYITNGGAVEFSDPSPSTFGNLTNVEVRGDGVSGIDYGFYIHDVIKGIYVTTNLTSVTFSYIKMVNVADYGIYMSNPSHVYDGTNNPNSLYYDIHFLHFQASNLKISFLQLGSYTRIADDGVVNMARKIEFAWSTIEYANELDLIRLNKVMDANVHHNVFRHLGLTDFRHSGMIYLYGNGAVHHNYFGDYWGTGVRAHTFSFDTVGTVSVYNNIFVNSRKYSGVETMCFTGDLQFAPYVHYSNFKIYNNTFGNLSAADFDAAMVDVYDGAGGTIEIKNNLGFNIERDLPYDPKRNYIYQEFNLTKPDTAANIYRRDVADLFLVNDSACMTTLSTPGVDKGLSIPLVSDDIDGVPRPQSGAWDIGAREYKTGIIFPIAKAGPDINVVLPADSAKLDGSNSFNPGGGTLSYKWSQVSGPSSIKFVNDTLVKAVADSLVKGSYLIQLTVTNAAGRSSSDTLLVVVSTAPLVPPSAHAGNDISITLPQNTATLDGSSSVSNGGGPIRYAWSKVSGPTGFTISGDTTAVASLGGLTAGTYVFRLLVTDTNGLSSVDTVNLLVNPAPMPSANAGADISLTLPVNSTNLNGTASTTPDGGALQYAWAKVSGPATFTITGETTATPSLSGLVQGVYQFKLTVTNFAGSTSSDLVEITVLPAPVAVANAGSDISINLPGTSTTLNGTGSYSTGGGTLSYAWSFVSGPAGSTISGAGSATPTVSGLTEGVYIFSLQVTNQQGSSATDQVQVTVNKAVPVYPIASAGADVVLQLPTNSTTLDGSRSIDPAGGSLTYSWTKISGPSLFTIGEAGTATPALTSLTIGNYQFRLTVTNSAGLQASDTVSVTVTVPLLPVAVTGNDTTINYPNSGFVLNGTASYAIGGASLSSYRWVQVTGPVAATLTGSNAASATVTGLMPGEYSFKLTVTDNRDQSGEKTIRVTVADKSNSTQRLLLYPNPSAGVLHIKAVSDKTGPVVLRISSVAGIVMHQQEYEKTGPVFEQQVDVLNLSSGTYILEIVSGQQTILLGKFIRL